MAAETMALLRWTGRGSLADLESSTAFVLKERRIKGKVWKAGNSLVVEGPEPLRATTVIEHMPGIAWTAAGFVVRDFRDLGAVSGDLARKYLRSGERFSVETDVTSGVIGSDVSGAVTSGVLEAVKRARVSLEAPKVKFRAAFDGGKGVVGVQVSSGPGGTPTGKDSAVCLVSGGMHSSVVAWTAVLDGFRVHLVHAMLNEDSLLAVARLYSELSFRADPRWLELTVTEGGSVAKSLAEFATDSRPVFGGFHHSAAEVPAPLRGIAVAPLYLLPEELFLSEFRSLAVKEDRSKADWRTTKGGRASARRFGGTVADVSEVLDGLG
jgi:hypothetical protein